MQFDNPLLTALVLLGLPLLGLNLAAWWWQRRQGDPLWTLGAPMPLPGGPRLTMAETRLRVGTPLRAGLLALAVALGLTVGGTPGTAAALAWPGTALLAVVLWYTAWLWLWELRFDSVGLSAPRALWRRSYLWRQLVRVSDDNPFTWHFHFADGACLRVPKHIDGHDELMRMAGWWLAGGRAPR